MLRFTLLFTYVLVAQGSLLVTSLNTDSVLRYDSATGTFLGTFIPSGSGGLSEPRGIAIAPDGNLLVSSFGTDQILRYSSDGAFVGIFADSTSGLNGPFQLAAGPGGVLFAASSQSDAILKYDAASGAFLGIFVSDTTMPPLNTPRGLAAGNGRVYTSTEGDRIRIYDLASGMLLVSPFGDNPRGMTIGPNGNLFVSYAGPASAIAQHDGIAGTYIADFVTHESGGLLTPIGVAFRADGDLYVASQGTNEILRYNGASGTFVGSFVSAGSGGLSGPQFFLDIADVPEPGTVTVLIGLVVFFAFGRRRRQFRRKKARPARLSG